MSIQNTTAYPMCQRLVQVPAPALLSRRKSRFKCQPQHPASANSGTSFYGVFGLITPHFPSFPPLHFPLSSICTRHRACRPDVSSIRCLAPREVPRLRSGPRAEQNGSGRVPGDLRTTRSQRRRVRSLRSLTQGFASSPWFTSFMKIVVRAHGTEVPDAERSSRYGSVNREASQL